MGRAQRALVGRRKALHWLYQDAHLVLRTADGLVEVKIPVGDLTNDSRMAGHFSRLGSVLTVEQADELDEIVAGAKP